MIRMRSGTRLKPAIEPNDAVKLASAASLARALKPVVFWLWTRGARPAMPNSRVEGLAEPAVQLRPNPRTEGNGEAPAQPEGSPRLHPLAPRRSADMAGLGVCSRLSQLGGLLGELAALAGPLARRYRSRLGRAQ
jgi:hypothetical protein